MLKRILLLLGETAASQTARAIAFRLTRDTGAALAGLAGIDRTALAMPSLGRAGTGALKVRLEQDLRVQAEDLRQRLHACHEAECAAQGIPFECLAFEGEPLAALQVAAETRDLVVAGHDTGFHGGDEVPLPDLLARLLARTPRPFLVCGDDPPEGEDVVVGYDASIPAMRALQLFALTGLGQGRRVKVVCVDQSQEEATRRAGGAVSYLASHGLVVEAVPVISRAAPSEALRLEVANLKAGLLVMGSYGHAGWRDLLFGSTTRKLAENPPCPLFVYH
ncbi:universal stress protein [Xanthobacter sp. V4C-4]|uniref:universal stress protein n=1 Tax=Xanthobacter cornucopiae TaxID=3119924 RepID=UPI00372C236C